tara:strand:- start:92 stop:337 length:246 start_codon:yes stop_codon:yes gene_type:complete
MKKATHFLLAITVALVSFTFIFAASKTTKSHATTRNTIVEDNQRAINKQQRRIKRDLERIEKKIKKRKSKQIKKRNLKNGN